ncbi:MAG TPA: rhodanese-like domain-containing protein, partial [Candidatus Sulfotelmatobacter sp.]|nr:rhodanese-like domain-containing protein [Candidatus Sulfotelmatobacter sp.]
EDLQRQLKAGSSLTFVDIRSATLFKQGHIPNAINVPAPLVPQKQLPPLGRVIVYDEGLGRDAVSAAVAALNQKPGMAAEILDGGLAAWEQAQSLTTHTAGLKPEELPMITYDHLKKTPTADLVLVDLRKPKPAPAQTAAQPLTDLSAEFPNAPVTHSPFALPPTRKINATGTATPPLMVLIDNGDGAAQETARILKANGIKRFVILAGGEEILVRKGQSGLQRIGSSMTVHRQALSSLTNTNR